MTQNNLVIGAFRGSIIAVFALGVFAASAGAQPVQAGKATSIDGVYNGSYAGDQGPIKFKLALTQQDNGTLAGSFTMYLPDGTDTKAYTCDIRGRYILANRMVQVIRGKWETAPPAGIDMPGMNGVFDPEGGKGAGQISGKMRVRPGPQFEAIRDADESAKLAEANAAKKDDGAPVAAATPPARRPNAANRAAPAPSTPPSSASPAPGPDVNSPTAINGVYTGGYQCVGAGVMTAKLTLKSTDDGVLTGLFSFDLPESAGSGSATYKLSGRYVAGNRWPFQFTTVEPVGKPAPDVYAMKSLSACFAQGALVQGKNGMEYSLNPDRISGPCNGGSHSVSFGAVRDKAASADVDKAMAAQASAASTNAPVAAAVRPVFEGVYNGTYTGKQGPTKFKLTLWMKQENKTVEGTVVNTNITGVLTLNVPEGSDTKAYTCELAGFYIPNGNLQLTAKRWEVPPPSNVAGLQGKFAADGGGQISGYMSDASNSKFQAIRDAAESGNMDSARFRSNTQPGIPGVFNGTYTRENELPAKMKLTITRTPDGLGGVATIYLPIGSGTKPYTYSLKGALDGHGDFHLFVYDWETMPPKGFKNFKAMGFNGNLVLNLTQNTARIISVPASVFPTLCVPKFEATWDAKESADIPATIAAQKAVGDAEQVAAMKARAEMMKNAPPKELASKDLVRKSRQYWEGYQTDMIREVFDGGFGAAMDENKEFQKVFCTYLEMLSAKFPDCLPANHVRVTNTVRTNRKFDENHQLISEENHDYTVDMDPRFVDGYKRCSASLNSKGEEIRGVIAIGQPGGAQRMLFELMAVGKGMQKFFADHGGKSAATRQLNENFLRAINGEPSLQQAGGKIDGAAAESDKDLPLGRYARFVDGANAYFRERAKRDSARFGDSSSHDTALCQRLAELYEFHMSREEQYYYANDFEGRFLQIMGNRASCADPAWPQLHPDVEEAIAEVK